MREDRRIVQQVWKQAAEILRRDHRLRDWRDEKRILKGVSFTLAGAIAPKAGKVITAGRVGYAFQHAAV